MTEEPATDDLVDGIREISASRCFQLGFRILYLDIAALLSIHGDRKMPAHAR